MVNRPGTDHRPERFFSGEDGPSICAILCPAGAGGYNAREYTYV